MSNHLHRVILRIVVECLLPLVLRRWRPIVGTSLSAYNVCLLFVKFQQSNQVGILSLVHSPLVLRCSKKPLSKTAKQPFAWNFSTFPPKTQLFRGDANNVCNMTLFYWVSRGRRTSNPDARQPRGIQQQYHLARMDLAFMCAATAYDVSYFKWRLYVCNFPEYRCRLARYFGVHAASGTMETCHVACSIWTALQPHI